MIIRTYDTATVANAVALYEDNIVGFEPQEWLDNPDNIALTDMFGNISLFEYQSPGVYYGHYFFHDRGKAAVELAKDMLWVIFHYPQVKVIKGLTPVTNRAARWLSRHIGFNSYGIIDTITGPSEVFILTKEEYNGFNLRRQ